MIINNWMWFLRWLSKIQNGCLLQEKHGILWHLGILGMYVRIPNPYICTAVCTVCAIILSMIQCYIFCLNFFLISKINFFQLSALLLLKIFGIGWTVIFSRKVAKFKIFDNTVLATRDKHWILYHYKSLIINNRLHCQHTFKKKISRFYFLYFENNNIMNS